MEEVMITVYEATLNFTEVKDLDITGEMSIPDATNGDSGEVLISMCHFLLLYMIVKIDCGNIM